MRVPVYLGAEEEAHPAERRRGVKRQLQPTWRRFAVWLAVVACGFTPALLLFWSVRLFCWMYGVTISETSRDCLVVISVLVTCVAVFVCVAAVFIEDIDI
jgi:fatty acid desaturase